MYLYKDTVLLRKNEMLTPFSAEPEILVKSGDGTSASGLT
jgi:hypothetical protein